jgi:6,7-dimethyl-8-ribityllumazine synthase
MTTNILIVEARYYAHISDMLLDGATAVLEKGLAHFERLQVPGALEIPPAIALAAQSGRYDGYIALGCVIRGETYHFEIVSNESARGLMDLGIQQGLAIGNGILTVETEHQAMERAAVEDGDKGGDAARACLALVHARSRFGDKQ